MIDKILKKENIFIDAVPDKPVKDSAIELISRLCSDAAGVPWKPLKRAFMEREAMDSTGFGEQLAIPHAKVKGLKNPMAAVIRFRDGVDWKSVDGIDVKVAIALIMPEGDKDNLHLMVLSKFARKLVHPEFMERLIAEKDPEALYSYIIKEMEE